MRAAGGMHSRQYRIQMKCKGFGCVFMVMHARVQVLEGQTVHGQ